MKSPILDLRFSNPPRRSRNPPNVEKEMLIDDEVRVAAYSLQSIPIIWYRKCKSKAKYKAGGGDATSINDSKSTEMHQYNNDDKNNNESEGNYIGIESSLSVIDNKVSGLAVLVSTSLSAQLCQGYDIIDIDSNLDEVRNYDDEKDEPKDFFEPYIERTIPLNNIDYALPGGNWEWENILQVGSGSCSCHVKVIYYTIIVHIWYLVFERHNRGVESLVPENLDHKKEYVCVIILIKKILVSLSYRRL